MTEWKKFWTAVDNKPQRRWKKLLTVEESKHHERLRKLKYVVKRIKEGKCVHHLLNNHSYAELFTKLDLDRLVLRHGNFNHNYTEIFTKQDVDRLILCGNSKQY